MAVIGVALAQPEASPQAPELSPTLTGAATGLATQRALIDKFCVTCHNARLKTGGLLLDELDLARLGQHAEIGETVVRKLRAGLMPPTGMPRPDATTMESLIRWMESELDRSSVTHLP
ncbi:MAG: hypothetical protein ACRDF6_07685, partial [bacterium]